MGKPPQYEASQPGQLSLLPSVGQEMSTGQNAVTLCSWGVKAGSRGSIHRWMHMWVAGKTVKTAWSLVNMSYVSTLWWVKLSKSTIQMPCLLYFTLCITNDTFNSRSSNSDPLLTFWSGSAASCRQSHVYNTAYISISRNKMIYHCKSQHNKTKKRNQKQQVHQWTTDACRHTVSWEPSPPDQSSPNSGNTCWMARPLFCRTQTISVPNICFQEFLTSL